MKIIYKISLLCLVLLTAIFALPGPVYAQSPNNGDGKVVFGESYHLNKGETLNGDLAVFGGNAVIDQNATVNGSVIITGGSLEINGVVTGDVTSVGGATNLGSTAIIHGSLTTVGVTLHRDQGAQVLGNVVNGRHWARISSPGCHWNEPA
jgi:cytoskeletal protein CcmA (bactofilin family)